MRSITGSGELTVGVRILDCDHRQMAETIMELQVEIAAGRRRGQAGLLLTRLAGFALVHFALEESMMAAAKYPGLDLHCLSHQRMMRQIRAMTLRRAGAGYAQGDCSLCLPVDWHSTHIENDDLDFGLWLNEIDRGYPSNDNCAAAHAGGAGLASDARS